MKKLLLVFLSGCVFPAFGQHAAKNIVQEQPARRTSKIERIPVKPNIASKSFVGGSTAKTTAVTIYAEDFSSGSASSLPTGWDAASPVNTNWTWRNTEPLNYFTRGNLESTTTANGYMIFRADSLADVFPTTVLEGYLTSPTYDFTANPLVGLEFQQFYTNFQDSCYVEVNNGGGWVRYDVFPNNILEPNDEVPSNPHIVKLNISEVAGNQGNVQIRFHYMGRQGGAYQWMIDDIRFTELDPVDAAITDATTLLNVGAFTAPIGITPLQFVDTVWPGAFIANYGDVTPGVNVTSRIYRDANTTPVYEKNFFADTLGVNLFGGFVDFTDSVGYLPNAVGIYTVTSQVNVPGDADLTNDADTSYFRVADSSLSNEDNLNYRWGLWAHTPAPNEESQMYGSNMIIGAGKSDTITSISVAFLPTTTKGVKVQGQIYTFNDNTSSWVHVASTVERELTNADVPTGNTLQFATLRMDYENWGYTIIGDPASTTETSWAAVIQINEAPANSTVRIWGSDAPGFRLFGLSGGVQDTSFNDGTTSFGQGTVFNVGNISPAIRMNFKNNAEQVLAVNNVKNSLIASNAYPNPAVNSLNVTFTLVESTSADITVTNAVGQVVKTQSVGFVAAKQPKQTTINTSDLANGVYFYTVNANGQKVTRRFVVSH